MYQKIIYSFLLTLCLFKAVMMKAQVNDNLKNSVSFKSKLNTF